LVNFSIMIGNVVMGRLMVNTITLWLASFLAAAAIGLLAALLSSRIKNLKTAAACAALFLLPAFLPAAGYRAIAASIFPAESFINADAFLTVFVAQSFLPIAAPIAFCGAAAALIYRAKGQRAATGALAGWAGASLLLCFTMLLPALETLMLTYSPAVYAQADTLDTYQFRSSLQNMNFGPAAAVFVIRVIGDILLALVPAILLFFWLRGQERTARTDLSANAFTTVGSRFVKTLPWIVSGLISVAALLAAGLPDLANEINIPVNILMSVFLIVLGAAIGFALSFIILRGLQNSGRWLFLCFAVLIMASSQAMIGQWVLGRETGLIHSELFTPLTAWMLPSSLLLMLIFALIARFGQSRRTLIFFALCLACLVAALIYGGLFPGIILERGDARYYSPGLWFYGLLQRSVKPDNGPVAFYLPIVHILTGLPCLLLGFAGAVFARTGLLKILESSERAAK
jgi:hypothetical protein